LVDGDRLGGTMQDDEVVQRLKARGYRVGNPARRDDGILLS
jgi:hypothetical protein